MRKLLLFLAWLSLSAVTYSQSLVAYYPFNGNANDESGNSRNPTYNGATLTADRFGNTNKAYAFSGAVNGHIEYSANGLPAANRTISLWFYVPDVSNRPGLLGYGGNGSCATTLLMGLNCTGSGQYWVQGHCGNNPAAYTYPSPPVNQWYHWVLTINGSAQKIYINGVLKSTDNTFTGSTSVAGSAELSFGVIPHTNGLAPYTDANVGYLQGKLDDIRIYDAAMSDAQVLQLYQSELLGLVAYYPFNGNANDESGNGNNGTVNGAALTADRFGDANKAYTFTNPNHISVLNSNLFGNEFSLSYWYKVNSYFGQRGVISNVAIPNGGFQQSSDGTSFSYILGYSFTGGYSPNYFYANYTMQESLSQWHHLVLTYKKLGDYSSETRLYIDGDLKKSDAHTMPITFTPNATFYIGQNHGGLNFQGDLDEIRIYNRVLSSNEIAQLADKPMMPDLLAYLPMNDDVHDVSGNNRNGSPYGGAVLTADKYGNANSAVYVNGNDCGVSLANTNTLDFTGQPFAISAWVKYSNITGAPSAIAAKHNCGYVNGYVLGVWDNVPSFFMASGSSWSIVNTPQPYSDNKWHHLVATFDGVSSQKLYVDGELKGSALVTYDNAAGSGVPVIIGDATGSCTGGTFSASIDEVKIYGAVLDEAQIKALYKQSRGSGSALLFRGGTSDIVTIKESLTPPPAISLEAWVKRNAVQSTQWILAGHSTNSWQWGLNGSVMILAKVNGEQVLSNTISIDDGKWHHLAVVSTGTTANFYCDGLNAGSAAISSAGIVPGLYSIGNSSGTTNSFDGVIDELRIWGTALSQTTLQSWMCRKITATHPDFDNFGYYFAMDETNLYKVYDAKNGNTGLITGATGYVSSGAPIGDSCAFDYSNTIKTASVQYASNESITATASSGNPAGISVYLVKDAPALLDGTNGVGGNDHYYGVHVVGGTNPQYTVVYNYTGNVLVSPSVEASLALFKRTDNSVLQWSNSNAVLNTTTKSLTVSGTSTEYVLGSSGEPLAVDDIISAGQNILVFPNPASQQVTIRGVQQFERVQLVDITGKLIIDKSVNRQTSLHLNLSGLTNGMYLLRLSDRTKIRTVKLIVVK
ncbi:MAG: T9SS type A sorting domain-containing protein [Lacibacter sp.]